jgi:dihydroorotate dehydrogenase (fumarate)
MSVDLTTTYLGRRLRSPLVASSSPLGRDLDQLRAMVDAGVGAVVLPSLFEEQVTTDAVTLQQMLHQGAFGFAESPGTMFPEVGGYGTGPDPYVRHLAAAAEALDVPVIASLNGVSVGGWTRYARLQQDAGAAAIELNPYVVAADPAVTGSEVDDRLVDLVAEVCSLVEVPVAVKLSPSHSALANLAVRLVDAGAAGLVLFNRFLQPDVDLDRLDVVDEAHLSGPGDLLAPLRWCALLREHVPGSLALTSGVHDGDAATKAMLVGADVAMVASALLRHGPGFAATILDGLERRLDQLGYTSVAQAHGALAAHRAPDPEAYERAHYVHALTGYRNAP